MNVEQLSMLEVALELMNQRRTPQPMTTLIKEVLEVMGIDDPNGDNAAQLYMDITTSSDFVYCGEGKWDLKSRQSLDLFDRDGASFNTGEEVEDEEEVNLDDYNIDEEESKYDDDDDNEDEEYDDEYDDEYDESAYDDIDPTEDDDEVDYLDEQEYNDIMDDYEDMYEDN